MVADIKAAICSGGSRTMTESNPTIESEFQRIRDALLIPRDFPGKVIAEAEAVASRDPLSLTFASRYSDLRGVPFVTIDPPESMDLDQAFFAARQGDGYLVHYAIDDIGFFVDPGGAIEREGWRRGQTLYSPDTRTPLYPPTLSEKYASLLPGTARPAIVFTFSLNARAEAESFTLARAVIESRAKLAYPDVSWHLDQERKQPGSGSFAGQEWSPSLGLLEEIGRKRQQLEAERGGVSLRIPAQQVERWSTALTGYRLAFEMATEVEGWNAQISLMTGMVAAEVMISHGVGLLRALDPPHPERVRALRLTAAALGVAWPESMDYDDFVRSLDPGDPTHAVMLQQAARVMGGARYVAFEGAMPEHATHAAIAAPYAHVTAPLRRLADRYALDLLVELSKGDRPAPELIESLQALPKVM